MAAAMPGPQPPDASGRICGRLRRAVPLYPQPSVAVDAAVIKLADDVEFDNAIGGHVPTAFNDLWANPPDFDLPVLKHGAATELTRGTLTPIASDHRVEGFFPRYTSGWWAYGDDQPFAVPGDSGSMVVDEEHRLIGMAVAIEDRRADSNTGTFVHGVQQIFSALRIDLWRD